MNDEPQHCDECGRARWSGDRFCGQCGSRFSIDSVADAVPVIDIDAVSLNDRDDPTKVVDASTGSNKLMVGLAGLGFVALALFAVAVVTRSPETATAPPATPAAAAEVAPSATAEAPTPVEPTTVAPTPVPPPTSATAPASQQIDDAAPLALRGENPEHGFVSSAPIDAPPDNAIADLGLGPGWLATVSGDGTPTAVNLETGEVVTVGSTVDSYGSILTPNGIYSPSGVSGTDLLSGSEFRQEWEFVPWDGSQPTAVELPGFPVHAYIDDDVGPVVIVSVSGEDGSVRVLVAVALESGDQIRVDVDVDLWLMQVGFRFAPLLQRSGTGFMIEVGSKIYRWTWADEWTEIGAGRVVAVSGDNLIVSRCEGPADCELSLVNADGDDSPVDIALGSVLSMVVAISPDGSRISRASGGINLGENTPNVVTILDVAAGTNTTIPTSTPAWTATWAPNNTHLLVSGAGTVTALDVATSSETLIDFAGDSSGTVPVVFLDDLNR